SQEVRHAHAGDGDGVLECQEKSTACPILGRHLDDVLAVEKDLAPRHLVARMAHQGVRERSLTRTVWSHERVDLALGNDQVEPAQNLLVFDRDVQVANLQLRLCHAPSSLEYRLRLVILSLPSVRRFCQPFCY